MSVLLGAFLGLLQGLCEFLPVSSSGHMLLARLIFGIQDNSGAMKMLDILLHVGTLIPVVIVFWKEWLSMVCHPFRDKTLLMLVIASLPTLAVYLLAKVGIRLGEGENMLKGFAIFDNGWFLGVSFLMTALFLVLCDALDRRKTGRIDKPGVLQAVVMGLFQGIGMIPGVSRSGSTITGGVLTGLDKKSAARFSFMMSAPAIVGSLLMEGKDAIEEGYVSEIALFPTLAGILVAAVTGYLAIRFMLRIIEKVPMKWFSLYLAVIGVTFLVLQFIGIFPAFAVPVPGFG